MLLLTCHLCIDTRQASSSTANAPTNDSHKLGRVFKSQKNPTSSCPDDPSYISGPPESP